MRLNRHLAHAGVASRRAAEELIAAGRVTVDGVVVTDPARDVEGATVAVDGRPARIRHIHAVLALHKPPGVLSTARDPQGRRTVLDLVDAGERRLYPVGRLDADSSGLILLTDDGELAHRLTHPSFGVPRVYRVRVGGGPVGAAALQRLRRGVTLDDGPTAPADVRRVAPSVLELCIHEGRNRQVRRMCEAVGHPVRELVRVAFGPLRLGELAVGRSRRLSAGELGALRAAVGLPEGSPAPSGRSRR